MLLAIEILLLLSSLLALIAALAINRKPYKGKNKKLLCSSNQPYVFVDIGTLSKIANQQRLVKIARTERLNVVSAEVVTGVTTSPLIVVVDNSGKVALKDGHHRILACRKYGYRYLPVAFKESRRINSHGVHVKEVLPGLLAEPDQ